MENTAAPLPIKSPALSKRQKILRRLWSDRYLYLLILPGITFFIIFSYAPMYGIVLAFKKYMVRDGILGSPWVGFSNFTYVFGTRDFWNAVRNTLAISFGRIITGFPVPIIFALMLNELRSSKFRRVTQMVLYLPHFVSWIIVAALIYNLLSVTTGVLGKLMISLDKPPIGILGNISYIRGLIYTSSIWKGAGWGTIIYLAAITAIDPTLYEAAMIDGAGRFRQIWHITMPGLAFAITINLILTVGNVMDAGFDQIFQLYNPGTYAKADIIDTYVYRIGLVNGRFEISTVVGLFKSVINCVLVLTANMLAKALGQEGLY